MKPSSFPTLLAAALLALPLAEPAAAQSNVIPGTDVALGILDDLTAVGRQGAFPNGMNAVSMATTSCNKGSVEVPWFAPMDEDHPMIAFLVAREDDSGRMFQISDYSYVKHGFFALADSQCDNCQFPSSFGTYLGINCSDTYAVSNNSNDFWLAPAEEIDPWLGDWEATCSFFDAGLNPTPSTACDGVRSFNAPQAGSLGPLGNRVLIPDAAFTDVGNPEYVYSSYYVVRGEPEGRRNNNLGWRRFVPVWNGFSWNFTNAGGLQYGSVLADWDGARVESAANGGEDGRVFVASKVTGPDANGDFHYEYALHNRDNFRSVGELRIPLCPSADVSNFGFRDVDLDVANNWTFTREGDELVIDTGNNPLRWNSIYNFWFDSSAGPIDGSVQLGQFFPGGGADAFAVASDVPGTVFDVSIGAGCGVGAAPELEARGVATLGNGGFGLRSTGHEPFASTLLFAGPLQADVSVGAGCSLYLGGLFGSQILELGPGVANGGGLVDYGVPVPANPALEGVDLYFQAFEVDPAGPAFGFGDLTNGLRVRVGDDTAGCL